MGNTDTLVELRNIKKGFSAGGVSYDVLTDLSFSVKHGETIAVVGSSGIGKSTLLHIVGTLDRPDSGELLFGGENVLGYDGEKLAEFRNSKIGFVFQFHHLLNEFTAIENVMMPLLISGADRDRAANVAERILNRVGLGHRLMNRASELSGGEQQRVAIGRALIRNPVLLLADEPTGNLDRKNSRQIHELLDELNKEYGMTTIVVTHNKELANYMERRVTLTEGRIQDAVS